MSGLSLSGAVAEMGLSVGRGDRNTAKPDQGLELLRAGRSAWETPGGASIAWWSESIESTRPRGPRDRGQHSSLFVHRRLGTRRTRGARPGSAVTSGQDCGRHQAAPGAHRIQPDDGDHPVAGRRLRDPAAPCWMSVRSVGPTNTRSQPSCSRRELQAGSPLAEFALVGGVHDVAVSAGRGPPRGQSGQLGTAPATGVRTEDRQLSTSRRRQNPPASDPPPPAPRRRGRRQRRIEAAGPTVHTSASRATEAIRPPLGHVRGRRTRSHQAVDSTAKTGRDHRRSPIGDSDDRQPASTDRHHSGDDQQNTTPTPHLTGGQRQSGSAGLVRAHPRRGWAKAHLSVLMFAERLGPPASVRTQGIVRKLKTPPRFPLPSSWSPAAQST